MTCGFRKMLHIEASGDRRVHLPAYTTMQKLSSEICFACIRDFVRLFMSIVTCRGEKWLPIGLFANRVRSACAKFSVPAICIAICICICTGRAKARSVPRISHFQLKLKLLLLYCCAHL